MGGTLSGKMSCKKRIAAADSSPLAAPAAHAQPSTSAWCNCSLSLSALARGVTFSRYPTTFSDDQQLIVPSCQASGKIMREAAFQCLRTGVGCGTLKSGYCEKLLSTMSPPGRVTLDLRAKV